MTPLLFGLCSQTSTSLLVALTPCGGRNSSAFTNVNIAEFNPIPSASATTTAALDIGRFLSIRNPNRTSRHHSVGERIPRCARCRSFSIVTLPNCRRAAPAASPLLIPCAV